MVKQILLVFLIFSFAFVQVQGVSRLFVDEITGYTNEDVRGTNIRTDLLMVDEQSVVNGVTIDGGDGDHVIDTPGKVLFNGNELDFTATNSVELTSLGENVGFEGNLDFRASDDFTIEGVDASIVSSGDITGTIGGTFSTFGTDADIRSIFDMTFNAGGNVFLFSVDQALLTADTVNIVSISETSFFSEESNIFMESLIETSISAGDSISVSADSGLEIGSAHGKASFDVENNISVLAENFIYTTETNSFSVANSLHLESQSIAGDVFMYTERSYITNQNGGIILESTGTDSQTAALTSGTIETMSETFTSLATDIVILSVDGTTFTSRDDVSMSAVDEISFLASGGMVFAGGNTFLTSTEGSINMDANGKAFITSRGADILMNTADTFTFTSFSSSVSAEATMQLNSDDFTATAGFMDFYSFRDINVNVPSFSVTTLDAQFDSHESTTLRQQSASFTASDDISIFSTGDIFFQNSAVFSNTAVDEVSYFFNRQGTVNVVDTTVDSGDEIRLFARNEFSFSAGGAVNFDAPNLIEFSSENMDTIAVDDVRIDAEQDVSFTGNTAGSFTFETTDTLIDFASNANIVSETGNVVFTAGEIRFSEDEMNVNGQDIIISATESIRVAGADELEFESPSTFLALPTTIITDETTLSGGFGVTLGAGRAIGDQLTVEADSSFSSTHNDVDIQGGSISVNSPNIILGLDNPTTQDVTFSVSRERDLSLLASSEIEMRSVEDFQIFGFNILLNALSTIAMEAEDLDVTSEERYSIFADNVLVVSNNDNNDAFSISIQDFGEANFVAESDIFLLGSSGDFGVNDALTLYSGDVQEFNMENGIISNSRDFHVKTETWSMNVGGNADFSGGQIAFYFDAATFQVQTDLDFDASEFESDSVENTDFNAGEDFSVFSQTLSVLGGDINIEATSLLEIQATTDDVTIGSTKFTPADPVYENVNLNFKSLITNAQDDIEMIATSTELFEKLGISAQFSSLDVSSDTFSTNAFRGVVVNAPTFTANTDGDFLIVSEQAHVTHATDAGSSITISADTLLSTRSGDGKMFFLAGNDIESNAGAITFTFGRHIYMETTSNNEGANADIEFESEDLMEFTGNALSFDAGFDGQIEADILFTSGAASLLSFGDDVRMRALGDEIPGQNRDQIQFDGGDNLNTVSFTVTAGAQLTFYPSGLLELTAEQDADFVSGTSMSFGSVSNEFFLETDTGSITIAATGDFSTKSGGVSGDIFADIGGVYSSTVGGTLSASANGTVAMLGGNMAVTAETDISFLTLNHDQGDILISGDDLSFTTLADPTLSEIDLIGRNNYIYADDTLIDAPIIEFGEPNVVTPRISAQVDDWIVTSTGDIVINAENDRIFHSSLEELSVEGGNIVMQSGGDFILENDGKTPGNSITLTAATDMIFNAFDYVEVHSGFNEAAKSSMVYQEDITLISRGKNINNGILINTDGSIVFTTQTSIAYDITTSATWNTENGLMLGTTFQSTSQSLSFDVDTELTFDSTNALTMQTTGRTAKIEVVAEGVNGDIEFGFKSDLSVSSAEDVIIRSRDFTAGSSSLTISSNGGNSGKITIDASDAVTMEANGLVSLIGADSFEFEATGFESELEMNAQSILIDTSRGVTYETDPDEGGSWSWIGESQSGLQREANIAAEDWQMDIDNNINVATPGAFAIDVTGNFELAAAGYLNYEIQGNSVFSSTPSSFTLESENADLSVNSGDNVSYFSTSVIVETQEFKAVVEGNATAGFGSQPTLFLGNGQTATIRENNGDINLSAYSGLFTFSGYLQFEAQATTGTGISISTSAPGGDFYVISPVSAIIGQDVIMSATGTAPETGFVKIIADEPATYSLPTINPQRVRIDSGDETFISTTTGDIEFEYASNLLVFGPDINVLAGRSVEFNVRGDGRLLRQSGAGNEAIVFETLFGSQFRTTGGGDVVVKSGASDIYLRSSIATIRSDVENMYIEASGTVSIVSTRTRNFNEAIDFDSTGDILFNVYDDVIHMQARGFWFNTPNVASIMSFTAEQHSSVSFTNIGLNGITVNSPAGDFMNSAGGDIIWNSDGTVSFDARNLGMNAFNDMYLSYTTTCDITADDIDFIATQSTRTVFNGDTFQYDEETNIIRISGREKLFDSDGDSSTYNDPTANGRPIVTLPDFISFRIPATREYQVSQGTYCSVNRAIAVGTTNQTPDQAPLVTTGQLCACVDHVWACVSASDGNGVYGVNDYYIYDRYNNEDNNRSTGDGNPPEQGFAANPPVGP